MRKRKIERATVTRLNPETNTFEVDTTPKRTRTHKIRPRAYHDRNRPHLKFVVRYRESGKPKRKFFESEAAAKSFAAWMNAEMKRNGIEGAQFPLWLHAMAQECTEVLSEFKKTIRDATQFYVDHLRASERSCTVKELLGELLDAKASKGVSVRHLDDLKQRVGKFADKFGDRIVATITSREVEEWLDSLNVGAQTRNHYLAAVRLAFNFAMRRKYATENPTEAIEEANVPPVPPGILTVEQAAQLLENASPEILPYIAIGLFAGLRTAELQRLDWSEIDFDSNLIEVKAEKSKTAQRRHVQIQPNLREWLLPLRKLKGSVTPTDGFRESFKQARVAAGITEWPDNALRHSFASYHMARFERSAAETAMELGHHDARITYRHYRELVKPRDAEGYWDIRPAKTSKKIVQMAAR
jgi:integrase